MTLTRGCGDTAFQPLDYKVTSPHRRWNGEATGLVELEPLHSLPSTISASSQDTDQLLTDGITHGDARAQKHLFLINTVVSCLLASRPFTPLVCRVAKDGEPFRASTLSDWL
jgi:hypothetical protein